MVTTYWQQLFVMKQICCLAITLYISACRQCSIRSKIHHYKYKKTGRENTFYPNTVAGKWNAKRPLELVVSDMTILKHKGKLHEWVYVLDTFNNEIISHHLGRRHGDPRPYYQCLEDLKQKKG